jgi:thiol-disulfide isomerase/thioredoxin
MKKLALILLVVLIAALLIACGADNMGNTDQEPAGADNGSSVDAAATDDADLLQFTATTLSGESISDKIFADYQLTMVNIWATFCNPCIEEMPELQQLYGELPQGVSMITICVDGDSEAELAQEIYDSFNGTFTVVLANQELLDGFLRNITAVPTTVFIDSTGKVIGAAQVGAPGVAGEGTLAAKYLQLISERLEQME